jgi:hypothetical protein
VEVLADGEFGTGIHELRWNASGRPTGVYFVRLKGSVFNETRKMLLIR